MIRLCRIAPDERNLYEECRLKVLFLSFAKSVLLLIFRIVLVILYKELMRYDGRIVSLFPILAYGPFD